MALKPTQLAVLDAAFVLRTARWPAINGKIVSRVAARARYLALTQAVTHLHRARARVLILFWLLAERWGTVTPGGVQVDLPLTHEVLAMLVGAHRPTVTIALQRLARAGFLIRERSDRWLLTRHAVECLGHPDSLALIEDDQNGDEHEKSSELVS
jgi:CRP-like cAMP-binding protein